MSGEGGDILRYKDALTDDFRSFPARPDLSQIFLAIEPKRTKYRIVDGDRVETYDRKILSPRVSESQVVLQSTYSIAGQGTRKRYLESAGAGDCVMATLYNPVAKRGSMVHFDNRSNISVAIREMIEKLGGEKSIFHMRILGGEEDNASSRKIVDHLRTAAMVNKMSLVEEDVLSDSPKSKSVNAVFDTETGELFDLPPNYSERFTPEQIGRMSETITEIMDDPLVRIGHVRFIENLLD